MNKLLVPTPSNGIRLFWDDLNYTLGYGAYDSGLLQGIESILKSFGSDFIVSGCEDLGGSVTADGWIMLSSNLVRVKQHTRTNNYFAAKTETNTTGDRTDNLGGSVNVYQQNRAEATSATGNLAYNGIRLNQILGLNISVRAITTNGTYNILDDEKIITVNSSTGLTTTINMPTPSAYNKGSVFNIYMEYTGSGALTIVGESGNLKSYAADDVSGVLGYMNDGTTWRLVSEKLTSNRDVEGVIKLAAVASYFALTNSNTAMTPQDVGYAMKSESITYTTSGTKVLPLNVGVVKVNTTDVDIDLPQDSGKQQVIKIYYSDQSATPADSVIRYSDDGITWSTLVDINTVADNKLYTFVNDGTTWRWTIEDYVEQT